VPNLVSFAASIAELAHGEKLRTQSITHSLCLFDARGTNLSLRNIQSVTVIYWNKCAMEVLMYKLQH